ncbi:hypothetical protein ES703_43983 [subsurface metagenome]
MDKKKYLITGGQGKLGSELRNILSCIAPIKEEMNILSLEQLETTVRTSRVNAILHLAAISDQRRADKNRLLSYQVNVIGTRNVAMMAEKYGLKLFYISTDYVFPGTVGDYSEDSVPDPANWYGYTKYAGELEIHSATNNFCIIRTSFRPSEWGFPTAYTNVYTTADYTDVIAKEILSSLECDLEGVIHIGTPVKTFYELAKRRNSSVKPEVCADESFPKRRNLNISRWLQEKKKRGSQ